MKILQSLLYGLALAGPQQDDTEEMCGGVSRISKKSNFKIRIWVKFLILNSKSFMKTSISDIDFRLYFFEICHFGSVFYEVKIGRNVDF